MRKYLFLPILLVAFAALLHAKAHPKLIVVIVVDQMRADYLDRFAAYETGGLHYFATQGADFVNANYQHSPTETCVGHAVVLSGRNPVHMGIVANEWYDRKSGKMIYCVADPSSPVIGGGGEPVSPKNLIGDNFSDWLQVSYPGARVYSLSLKDRAAIMLGGHRPQAVFWFAHDTGRFVTGEYCANVVPSWVEQFNNRKLVDGYAGKQWAPLLGGDSPAYQAKEMPAQFPHDMPKQAGHELNEAVYGSPFGDELLESLAEAAVDANHLGENQRAPDLLAISFSSNDAVGHTYGPDSPEIADEQIRLDRTLGQLRTFLNKKLGGENILWVLSADHGAEPTPEAEQQLRGNKSARRVAFSEAMQSVEKQLNAAFQIPGEMHWFAAQTDTMLYFDRAALSSRSISLEAANKALTQKVHDVPGICGFYDPMHLEGVPIDIRAMLNASDFPERSGDVYYRTCEWTLFSSNPAGTSHGDPWPYDTHVPMVFAGWQVQPKRVTEAVHVSDIAPTLADLTGVRPSNSEVIDGKTRKGLLGLKVGK